jgi:hypothetical protein
VWIPDEAQEALRDLTRAREDMKHLQRQAKQRLLSFLSRHGHRYTGRSRWTQAHWRWLEGIKFARPEQQIVLQEYIDTVQACGRRVAVRPSYSGCHSVRVPRRESRQSACAITSRRRVAADRRPITGCARKCARPPTPRRAKRRT